MQNGRLDKPTADQLEFNGEQTQFPRNALSLVIEIPRRVSIYMFIMLHKACFNLGGEDRLYYLYLFYFILILIPILILIWISSLLITLTIKDIHPRIHTYLKMHSINILYIYLLVL